MVVRDIWSLPQARQFTNNYTIIPARNTENDANMVRSHPFSSSLLILSIYSSKQLAKMFCSPIVNATEPRSHPQPNISRRLRLGNLAIVAALLWIVRAKKMMTLTMTVRWPILKLQSQALKIRNERHGIPKRIKHPPSKKNIHWVSTVTIGSPFLVKLSTVGSATLF